MSSPTLPGMHAVPKRRRVSVDEAARLLQAAFEAGYRLGYSNGHHDGENAEEYDADTGDAFRMWVFDTDEQDAHPEAAARIRALVIGWAPPTRPPRPTPAPSPPDDRAPPLIVAFGALCLIGLAAIVAAVIRIVAVGPY